MNNSKRIKMTTPAIKSRAEMEDLVGQICGLKNEERRLTVQMDEQIRGLKDTYTAQLTGVRTGIDEKMELARAWAEANPSEFGGQKSIEMVHGMVGWRLGMPQLKTLAGWTWDRVLEKLKTLSGMMVYIRIKEEVNKQALLNERELLVPEQLRQIGVRVVQDEAFFVEPRVTEVETREEAGAPGAGAGGAVPHVQRRD